MAKVQGHQRQLAGTYTERREVMELQIQNVIIESTKGDDGKLWLYVRPANQEQDLSIKDTRWEGFGELEKGSDERGEYVRTLILPLNVGEGETMVMK